MFSRPSVDVQPGDRGAGGASSAVAPLYEPLDPETTGEYGLPVVRGPRRAQSKCCCNTQGQVFNFFVGVVVCASALLLALEADSGLLAHTRTNFSSLEEDLSLAGVPKEEQKFLKSKLNDGLKLESKLRGDAVDMMGIGGDAAKTLSTGTYSILEYIIVLCFSLEVACRLCDQGKAYISDPWFGLDMFVLLQGIADLAVPFAAGAVPGEYMLAAMQMIRALRVLRIVKILRVSPTMRSTAFAFGRSFTAVVRACTVLLVLDFVFAIQLTAFVGHYQSLWGKHSDDIEAWFGSIGRSMMTLFKLSTLNGDMRIGDVLSEVLPSILVSVAIVTFIMLSFFTVVGTAAGAVSAGLIAEQRVEDLFVEQALEERRATFGNNLGRTLANFDGNRDGKLTRQELQKALDMHPEIFLQLQCLGADVGTDELLIVFDRLAHDAEPKGNARLDDLVGAIVHLSGSAKAAGVADLRRLILASRREAAEALKEVPREVLKGLPSQGDTRSKEAPAAPSSEQMAEIKAGVASMQEQVSEVQQGVKAAGSHVQAMAALEQRLAKLEALQEKEHGSRADVSATLTSKLDSVSAQVAEQAVLLKQADALATVSAKLDKMMVQLAEQSSPSMQFVAASPAGKPFVPMPMAEQSPLIAMGTEAEKAFVPVAEQSPLTSIASVLPAAADLSEVLPTSASLPATPASPAATTPASPAAVAMPASPPTATAPTPLAMVASPASPVAAAPAVLPTPASLPATPASPAAATPASPVAVAMPASPPTAAASTPLAMVASPASPVAAAPAAAAATPAAVSPAAQKPAESPLPTSPAAAVTPPQPPEAAAAPVKEAPSPPAAAPAEAPPLAAAAAPAAAAAVVAAPAEEFADFAGFASASPAPAAEALWTASFPDSAGPSPTKAEGHPTSPSSQVSQDDVLPMEPVRRAAPASPPHPAPPGSPQLCSLAPQTPPAALPPQPAAGAATPESPAPVAGATPPAQAATADAILLEPAAAPAVAAAAAATTSATPAAAALPELAEAAPGSPTGAEEPQRDGDLSSVDSVLGPGVMRDLSADEIFERLLNSDSRPA